MSNGDATTNVGLLLVGQCTLRCLGYNHQQCQCRYVLSNIESKKTVRRGDRVWQIAFGSGFKCNSAVWRSLRTINDQHPAWDDSPAEA